MATFYKMQYNFTRFSKHICTVIKAIVLPVFFVIAVLTHTAVYAGGKPVGKKRLFLIPAAAYFFNNTFWDKNGKSSSYDNAGSFGSTILSINSEYGFSRRVSLVGSIPFVINHFSQAGFSNSISGLGDAELGVRYYVANINYNVYFSVQGNLVLPLYKNTPERSLGYEKLGSEIRLISAGDFKLFSQKLYFEVNAGTKQFLGDSGPLQLKYLGSLSYSIDRKNQVSLAETLLYSFSSVKTFNSANPIDVVENKDFSFNQLTASYSYSIERNKSVFFSLSKFISGRNTGAGTTISVGYVYKY